MGDLEDSRKYFQQLLLLQSPLIHFFREAGEVRENQEIAENNSNNFYCFKVHLTIHFFREEGEDLKIQEITENSSNNLVLLL